MCALRNLTISCFRVNHQLAINTSSLSRSPLTFMSMEQVVGLVLNKRDWRTEPVRWTAPFDPRQRPWYEQAKDAAQIPAASDACAGGAVTAPALGTLERWSDIYLFAGDDAGLGTFCPGTHIV
jgi:hypothetical protein|eukprot:COSAG03_NODE_600_length_6771_cov_188.338429_7_plen_123_part_00